ncbi:ATP-binding protein [Nannocystis radixulma]|uniref:ATP-binding protein n=1 Tax=Nannocystis radixulma TaxID=2995305 RepID=A0ABT5BDN2_9BACT|nr:ATP-binding protein [Nannocystis radixulma]
MDGNLDYAEFLFRILHDETERRDTKQLTLRIRRANFEHERTLESFDFNFNPQVPRAKIIDLSTCRHPPHRRHGHPHSVLRARSRALSTCRLMPAALT